MKKFILTSTILLTIIGLFGEFQYHNDIPLRFTSNSGTVIDQIRTLDNFQNVELSGVSISSKNSSSCILTLDLINGENKNVINSDPRRIGSDALMLVLDSLENKEEFDIFKVKFSHKKSFGKVGYSFARSYDYLPEELL